MSSASFTLLRRHGLWVVLLSSLFILLSAHLYERFTGLMPCQLCWLQRWVFVGFAGLALLALPLVRWRWARWMFSGLFALLSLLGIAIAMRHLYIKLNPQTVSCGMDVETLLNFMPLFDALKHMLIGSSDCAQAANLLGLPLPSWSMAGYLVLGFLALWSLLGRR